MEAIEIAAEVRRETGTGPSRRLRRMGRIPATLYGPKCVPISITVDAAELWRKVVRLEGSHLVRLQSESSQLQDRVALVSARQHDPVSGAVLHADFYEVDLTQKIATTVALHYVGKPVGVTRDGGILQPVRREVEVSCLPADIPAYMEVDVSGLAIHDSLHISDLKLPPGVEAAAETDYALVTVLPPTVEEVKVEAPAEGEAEAEAAAEAATQAGGETPASEGGES